MVSSPADIHVLHVDDDPAFLQLVQVYLEREVDTLRVESVEDARDGLQRLEESDPVVDCVLSDYDMPQTDGLDFLARIRETRPNLPFILYTGKGGEEIAAEAIGRGVNDYMQKGSGSAHFLTLGTRIRREVDHARANREKETRLEALEAAREGICIVDAEGKFRYANQSYLDLYGYDEDDLVGEPWQLLHPDDVVAEITAEVLPTVEAQGEWGGRSVGLRSDGTTFRESKSVSTLPGGELVIVVTEHDATLE